MSDKTIKAISGMGETSAVAGMTLAAAAARFLEINTASALSARLGFDIGWVYLAGFAFCALGALYYFAGVKKAVTEEGATIAAGAVKSGSFIFFLVGLVVVLAGLFAFNSAAPMFMLKLQSMGVSAVMASTTVTLLPIIILMIGLRLLLSRWAHGLVIG